mmetsp:Transcript_17316/g.42296  ORF Transcript_17316/g.42296 Transcript_17316/m.42296 type:complete len:209 (+) Transcript_17316:2986-3612(+)
MGNLSTFAGLDWHDHLHGLDFDVWFTNVNLTSTLLQVSDNLSGYVSAQFGRIENGRHENRDTIHDKTQSQRFIHSKDFVSFSIEVGNNTSFGSLSDSCINNVSVKSKAVDISGQAFDVERVLDILVRNFDAEGIDGRDRGSGNLTLGKRFNNLSSLLLNMLEGFENGSSSYSKIIRSLDLDALFTDDSIQPRCVNGVINEGLGFQKLN